MMKSTATLSTAALITTASMLAGCATDDSTHHSDNHLSETQHSATQHSATQESDTMGHDDSIYAMSTNTLEGDPIELGEWKGRVALVVNVASECGLTPQYEGLQALHDEYSSRGFTVLAFPSNDFGGQEPGTAEEIRTFCTTNFDVGFPMFEKVQTKTGDGQSPIYARLESKTGALPEWNFSKYLVARDGTTVTYFGPRTEPNDPELVAAIVEALSEAVE